MNAGVLDMDQCCITHLHGSSFSDGVPTSTGRPAAWSADGRSFAVAGADGVRVLDFSSGGTSPCAVGGLPHATIEAAVLTQLLARFGARAEYCQMNMEAACPKAEGAFGAVCTEQS